MRRVRSRRLRKPFSGLDSKMRSAKIFALAALIFSSNSIVCSQNSPCKLDEKTLQFAGTAKEQAKCLLRQVKARGILDETPASLPKPLDKIIGAKVNLSKGRLRRWLIAGNILEATVGGSLDDSLSAATLPNGTKVQA